MGKKTPPLWRRGTERPLASSVTWGRKVKTQKRDHRLHTHQKG